MTATETETSPETSTDSPEEPEMPEHEEVEHEEGPETEEEVEEETDESEPDIDEPDIYEFSEESGYTAGDLERAYEAIDEEAYQVKEEDEKVLIGDSSWNEIEGMLSEGEDSESWTDRVKSYLFDHDKEYGTAGATGLGAGLFTGFLGYTTAAGLMITGGAGLLGWGVGSYLGDRISEYLSDEETEEEPSEEPDEDTEVEHELSEYSDWEVEIVDEEAYGEAVEEYMQQAQ
jgi:hypothetical protein